MLAFLLFQIENFEFTQIPKHEQKPTKNRSQQTQNHLQRLRPQRSKNHQKHTKRNGHRRLRPKHHPPTS